MKKDAGMLGYFQAKRQLQDALDYRIEILEKELELYDYGSEDQIVLEIKIEELEFVRNFVRNAMLWKNE